MPPATEHASKRPLLRTLIYGRDKTKKTWWALRCAELGFNVVLLNGDDGAQIVRMIPEEAQKKILILDLVDKLQMPVFSVFMAMLLRENNAFSWDEVKQERCYTLPKDNPVVTVQASKLTPNDVLIVDSWTALTKSTLIAFAVEHNIDLSEAEKTEWPGYGYQKRFLDWTLNKLHALNCHIIVIGHEVILEKKDDKGKVLSTNTIPISSSNPHSLTITKEFNDVLYFERLSSSLVNVKSSAEKDRAGGSRNLAPGSKSWDEWGPSVLFDAIGVKADPEAKLEGFVWQPAGATKEIIAPNTGPSSDKVTTIQAGVATPKLVTSKSLFPKK